MNHVGEKRVLRIIKILRILKIIRLLKGFKIVEYAISFSLPLNTQQKHFFFHDKPVLLYRGTCIIKIYNP